jgi:hypothetical protein
MSESWRKQEVEDAVSEDELLDMSWSRGWWSVARVKVLARQAQRKARIAQAVAAGARPYVARWGLGPNAVVWDGKVYRVVDLAGGAE